MKILSRRSVRWLWFCWIGLGLLGLSFRGGIMPMENIAENLSDSWKIYSSRENVYLPYLPSVHTQTRVLHLVLDKKGSRPSELLGFWAEQEVLLFVNNTFLNAHTGYFELSLDKLPADLSKDTSFVLLSFYLPQGTFESPPDAWHVYESDRFVTTTQQDRPSQIEFNPIERRNTTLQSWIVIFSLLLLLVVIANSHYLVPLYRREVFVQSLNFFLLPNYTFKRTDQLLLVSFAIYYALVLAFGLLVFNLYSDYSILSGERFLFLSVLTEWLQLFLLCLLLLSLHFILIQILSQVFFNQKQYSDLHLQSVISSTLLTFAPALPAVLVVAWIGWQWQAQTTAMVFQIFLFLYFSRSLFVSYQFYKNTTSPKLYLFSYLCISEYAPLVLIAQILEVAT
jgi:hypothetical protein